MPSSVSSTHRITSDVPVTMVLPSPSRTSALVEPPLSWRRTVYEPPSVARVASTMEGSFVEPPLQGLDSFAKRGPPPLAPKKAHRMLSKRVDLPAPFVPTTPTAPSGG